MKLIYITKSTPVTYAKNIMTKLKVKNERLDKDTPDKSKKTEVTTLMLCKVELRLESH